MKEAYIWSQAELEDMLFQARYQHLLFAYFGVSVHGSPRRGAILANLRWELNSNIATLCRRSDDVPSAEVLALRTVRRRVRLTSSWLSANSGRSIALPTRDARRVTLFWSAIMGTARSIKTEAIRQAIASGEFLEIDPASSSRVSGPVDIDLRRLADAIDRYSALSERLDQANDALAQVIQQINGGYPTVAFPPDLLVFLFAADDRIVDVLRLSGAIMRYVLDPSTPYTSPALRPVSPLEDAIEGLEAEAASHGDVEGWVRDDVLWGLLTDEPVSNPERKRASRERYPRFWKAADEGLAQQVQQIATRYGAELLRRKEIYGDEAANQWLDEILDREE